MSEFSLKCSRWGTLLKRQVIGSNEFYYCRKCGSISSAASLKVPAQSTNKQINIELISKTKIASVSLYYEPRIKFLTLKNDPGVILKILLSEN